jgi:tRNA/tmRNA/rRNA uracil-C5-methylase (TrmA/RlmC/RlmD family)
MQFSQKKTPNSNKKSPKKAPLLNNNIISSRSIQTKSSKTKKITMSKRSASQDAAIDQDMIDINTTAHSRTSYAWKKQKYNNKNDKNDKNDDENGDQPQVRLLNDQNQTIVDQNTAQLTPEAGLDATTPLRTISYTKQLSTKKKELWKTFTAMTRDIEKGYKITNFNLQKAYESGQMKEFVQYKFDNPLKTKHGICCVTGPVLPSPVDQGYRNKNEFTIGYGLDSITNQVTDAVIESTEQTPTPLTTPKNSQEVEIGFLCGRFIDGESRIGSPEGSLSAPLAVVEITRKVKTWLNTNEIAKKYTPWIKPDNKGLLRLFTVRDCPVTRQLMICLQINPISFTPEYDYLTKANPQVDGFLQLPPEEITALRKEHVVQRELKELENLQNKQMEEFSLAFRDFCVENFYGGAIWRQGVEMVQNDGSKKTFIPPHDSYDFENESSPDLKMLAVPSYSDNCQYANKTTYKPIPSDDSTVSTLGTQFTEKYNYSLASLIIQSHSGVANSAELNTLQNCLFGSHYIYAQLCDLFFRVSINSFLQVNIKAATSLYNVARHWAMSPKHDFNMSVDDAEQKYVMDFIQMEQRYAQALWDKDIYKTAITPIRDSGYKPEDLIIDPPVIKDESLKPNILFDVCCGTGTIGLINSSSAQSVVGIDIVQSAIDDAKANAELNNMADKAEFLCGKAEDVMETVLKRYTPKEIETSVAILDPPRNGLHTKVLAALRDSSLQRIVYISCNQKTLAEDVQRLCGPPSKNYVGAPFVPIAAVGYDLFPHTNHCEAVMLLERRPKGQGQHVKSTEGMKVVHPEGKGPDAI